MKGSGNEQVNLTSWLIEGKSLQKLLELHLERRMCDFRSNPAKKVE